jgi:hypothetical protein
MSEGYIDPAEDEVDARLSVRYTVPFTSPIPGMVKSLSIDVAYYKLSIRSEESEKLGEYLYGKDGKGGIFGQIVSGVVQIDQSLPQPNSAWVDKEYTTRFGPDSEVNWRPDSDSIVDAENDRLL